MATSTTRKKSSPRYTKLSAVPSWLEGINDVVDSIQPSKDGSTWSIQLAGGGELECDAPVAMAAGIAVSGKVTEKTITTLARLSLEHLARTEAMRLIVSKNPPASAKNLLASLKSALMEPDASRTVVDQLVKDGWIAKVAKKAAKTPATKTVKAATKKPAKKATKKVATTKVAKKTAKKVTKKIVQKPVKKAQK